MVESEQKMKNWLTHIFRNHDFDSFEFKFPDYDKNGGYTGEMEFADVIAEKNGMQKIIRLIIKKNKESKILMNTLNLREIYANEIKLYDTILPYFTRFAKDNNTTPFDAIPYCYGTVNKEDQFMIILENLKPRGYLTAELNKYFDMNHVKLVLEAYGKWHAFSLAFRDQNREIFDCLGTTQKENKLSELCINTIQHEIDGTIKLFKRENKNHFIENLEVLKKNYVKMFKDAITNHNEDHIVIKHGDSWNNNFLFHYDEEKNKPDKVVIIDWQLSYFSSPLVDVTNVIFSCCSRSEFEHIDDLLKFYYKILSKKVNELGSDPERVFSWEACLKSFQRYVPMAIAMIPLTMRMRYKIESDSEYDIEKCVEDGKFSGCHGDGVRNQEEYFEDIYASFEYVIERKWI